MAARRPIKRFLFLEPHKGDKQQNWIPLGYLASVDPIGPPPVPPGVGKPNRVTYQKDV